MTYLVTKRTECANCKGTGVVRNTLWDDFHAAERATYGPHGFQGHGNAPLDELFHRWMREWWEDQGWAHHSLPPEEHDCPECEGMKHSDELVPLADVLRELLEEV